jgi:hypothetical protein
VNRAIFILLAFVIASCSARQNESTEEPPERYHLSEAANMGQIQLQPNAREMLDTCGFVIVSSYERDLYDLYDGLRKRGIPLIVTTDLAFHASHRLFDNMLQALETIHLYPRVCRLTEGMLAASLEDWKMARDPGVKEAAGRNACFFGVASELLGEEQDLPEPLVSRVREELQLIRTRSGFASSPIFGFREDYSQYAPRGHYTRNQNLERYFLGMMWYGRMPFYLRPPQSLYEGGDGGDAAGRSLTQSALLQVRILNQKPDLKAAWETIDRTTGFLVGKSDDPGYGAYAPLVHQVYKGLTTPDDLADEAQLDRFMDLASELSPPRILSTYLIDAESGGSGAVVTIGYRLFGQKLVPDSYVFQNLVYDAVVGFRGEGVPFTLGHTVRGPQRVFPRGLDLLAALGSDRARAILEEEGDAAYANYHEQLQNLQQELSELEHEQWRSSLYWTWLDAIRSLVAGTDSALPPFMRTRAWQAKHLNAALAAWTEIRHDAVLYVKQSYTAVATGIVKQPPFTEGYVEPFPEVYTALSSLAEEASTLLPEDEPLLSELHRKALTLSDLTARLAAISRKELSGDSLTTEEYDDIWRMGGRLHAITIMPGVLRREMGIEGEEETPLVVDVHTDPNTGQVLQEAIGLPHCLYAVVPVGDTLVVAAGGMLPQYEFKHPMAERLTDEAWRAMVDTGRMIDLPGWFAPFTVQEEAH